MTTLSIALAQTYPKLGDIQCNLTRHLEIMDEVAARGTQLLVFPELSLTGYYLKDLVYELAVKPTPHDPIFGPLIEKSKERNLDAVIGFVEEDSRGRFFISSAYLSRGAVLHVHRKVYLPTYGLFDDGRFFAWGDSVKAFNTPYGRFGLLICEDFWHVSLPYILWQDGADVMIFANASPARGISDQDRTASTRWVESVNEAYGGLFGTFVIQCNRVGFEDGLAFGGGSLVIDTDGVPMVKAPYFEEHLLYQTIDLNQIRRTRSRLPLLRDERTSLMVRELSRVLNSKGEQGEE